MIKNVIEILKKINMTRIITGGSMKRDLVN